jgi:hypothetical protein
MADRAKHHFGARLEIQNNSKFVLLSVFSLHLTKHPGDSLLLFLWMRLIISYGTFWSISFDGFHHCHAFCPTDHASVCVAGFWTRLVDHKSSGVSSGVPWVPWHLLQNYKFSFSL